jgi:hypothetical protein
MNRPSQREGKRGVIGKSRFRHPVDKSMQSNGIKVRIYGGKLDLLNNQKT